jgi:phosphoesterase RecJ-like protein
MMSRTLTEKIHAADRLALVTHASPDGDAVGSTLALALALRALGKTVTVLSKEPVPENLMFLPLAEEYGLTSVMPPETELLLALDCGNKERLSMEREGFDTVFKINLDHHVSNDLYGDLNHVDPTASSTAEMVTELIEALGGTLSVAMAECLYTGIVSDTGSFRYPSTTAATLRWTAKILETGLDFSRIQRILFATRDFKRVKLLGRALMTLERSPDGFVSMMNLAAADFNTLSIPDRDSGEIVNYGLEPPEADVSILLKEAEGFYRVSVRTKAVIDAAALCAIFGGGGHVRAAGCNLKADTLEGAKKQLLQEIERMRTA